jgi:hypothetical protein
MIWMESYLFLRPGSSGEDALPGSAEGGSPKIVPVMFL